MATELARFEKLVDEIETRPEQGEQLAAALNGLQIERTDETRYEREVAGAPALPVPEGEAEPVSDEPVSDEAADTGAIAEDTAGEDSAGEDSAEEDSAAEGAVGLPTRTGRPSRSKPMRSMPPPRAKTAMGPVSRPWRWLTTQPSPSRWKCRPSRSRRDESSDEPTVEVAEEPATDASGQGPVTDAPQRFVEGDTGLLPSLVSAQLSALLRTPPARRGRRVD